MLKPDPSSEFTSKIVTILTEMQCGALAQAEPLRQDVGIGSGLALPGSSRGPVTVAAGRLALPQSSPLHGGAPVATALAVGQQ